MSKPLFEQMTIVGVGLLGGSLARACRHRGLAGTIIGFGRNPNTLEEAKRLNVIDAGHTEISKAVQDSDIVVLCNPVATIVPRIKEMLPHLKEGCIITDVGSVKARLVEEVEQMIPPTLHFVGGHPIAGGEKSGLAASSKDLYTGAKFIVTPTPKTDVNALGKVVALWEELETSVITMEVQDHDFIFGAVSHLPHVVAYALVNTIGDLKTGKHNDVSSFSGAGFKDFSRIAASDPVMWRDICLYNKDRVLEFIDRFQVSLNQIKNLIAGEQGDQLEKSFAAANQHRNNLVLK